METIRLIWTLQLAVSEYRIKSWRMLALFVRCGDYFATTNYDKLLEEVTGLGYYTYNMPGKIVQMLSGQAEMSVIHLHGIYDAATNMDDIVADQNSTKMSWRIRAHSLSRTLSVRAHWLYLAVEQPWMIQI